MPLSLRPEPSGHTNFTPRRPPPPARRWNILTDSSRDTTVSPAVNHVTVSPAVWTCRCATGWTCTAVKSWTCRCATAHGHAPCARRACAMRERNLLHLGMDGLGMDVCVCGLGMDGSRRSLRSGVSRCAEYPCPCHGRSERPPMSQCHSDAIFDSWAVYMSKLGGGI